MFFQLSSFLLLLRLIPLGSAGGHVLLPLANNIYIYIVCKARTDIRVRSAGIVVRVRVRNTAIRVRAVVRPVHNTTLEEVCLVFY